MATMRTGWERIAGHEWATDLLARAISQDRVGHAYLLTGPEQIGKTTLARLLAQALNCEVEPEERPCGECRSCRLIAADRHPDVRLLVPEVNDRGAQSIKIEQIRELQQALSLSAHEARQKVAILRRFDTASLGAANAFLKTLEEPPTGVVLLLTANEADSMLPTIVSRCRTLQLRPVPAATISDLLRTSYEATDEQAASLARIAAGRPGWAIDALHNTDQISEREDRLRLLDQAIGGNRVARFALAEEIARRPEAVVPTLQTWLAWWREQAQTAFGHPENDEVEGGSGNGVASTRSVRWSREEMIRGLQRTDLALRHLSRNGNTRLVLEYMLLGYPYR